MKITNKKLRTLPWGYRVVIKFAHGDDDYFSVKTYEGLDEESADGFVEMLSWIKGQPRYDEADEMWDMLRAAPRYIDLMTSLSGFWQNECLMERFDSPKAALEGAWGEEYWPCDIIYHGYRPARLERYAVEYVDEHGDVWAVA